MKKMARRKRSAYIDAAVSIAILLGVLWAFDRPLAKTILERTGWVIAAAAALAAVFVALAFAIKRARGRQAFVVQDPPAEARPEPLGASNPPRETLDRDPGTDRQRRDFQAVTEPIEKPRTWSLDLVKELEWKRFEMLCAGYFEAKGYHPKTTRIGADGGIDIILHRKGDPAGKIFGVVQCKAWSRAPVGIKPVRELFGVKAAEEAPLAVFITTTDYTKDAKDFAEGRHLELISGNKLVELLRGLPVPSGSDLLRKVTMGDYSTPTCPRCDVKMVLRTSKKGNNPGHQFWGCRNYPRCRETLKLPSRS